MGSGKVIQAILDGSGSLWNGHTYMSHAVACAGALAVLRTIEAEDLLENVRRKGEVLSRLLKQRFGQHRHVGDIRGRGLFWSLELVADRTSKEPFPASARLASRIKATAQENGLLCYPASGCVDGELGDHVLLAPTYDVTEEQLNVIVEILERTLEQCLSTAPLAA
jgi:adenosylmethionine-8-amino-7-oxononanoate aminotransferase